MTDGSANRTIAQLLMERAAGHPEAVAVIFPNARFSYRALLTGAEHRARALAGAGIEPGGAVAIAMDDGPEMLQLMLGATLLGVTAVLLSDMVGDTLAPRLAELDIGLLIAGGERGRALRTRIDDCAGLDIIDVAEPRYAAFLTDARPDLPPTDRPADPDIPAFVIFTAGVTGPPKQIPVTHRSLVCKAAPMIKRFELDETSRLWIGVSMFQIGFVTPFVAALACGATVVLTPGLDSDGKRTMIAERRVSHAYPIYLGNWLPILSSPSFMPSLFGTLSHVCLVGPVSALRRAQRALPQATVVTTYGSAEEGGAFCLSRPDDPIERRLGTSGRPFPGHEVRIFGTVSCKVLAPDKVGEIQVRGPGLPPPARSNAFASSFTEDGWLRTSDLGVLTPQGALVYQGRISEMLQIGDSFAFALEIEAVLAQHRDVALAQVIAWPDDVLGEAAAAFVELRPGAAVTAEELIAFASEHLPPDQVPRSLRVVAEWPTASSKILKSVLREWMAEPSAPQGADDLIDRPED